MSTPFAVLANERLASIRDVQKNPSKALRGITRVMRGSKTLGFFLSEEQFGDLVESLEAATSEPFLKRMRQAKRQMKAGRGIPLKTLAKRYGL